jgi:hypothetical protein
LDLVLASSVVVAVLEEGLDEGDAHDVRDQEEVDHELLGLLVFLLPLHVGKDICMEFDQQPLFLNLAPDFLQILEVFWDFFLEIVDQIVVPDPDIEVLLLQRPFFEDVPEFLDYLEQVLRVP